MDGTAASRTEGDDGVRQAEAQGDRPGAAQPPRAKAPGRQSCYTMSAQCCCSSVVAGRKAIRGSGRTRRSGAGVTSQADGAPSVTAATCAAGKKAFVPASPLRNFGAPQVQSNACLLRDASCSCSCPRGAQQACSWRAALFVQHDPSSPWTE